ncbi:hypothetical protein [Bacillus wiedmannii]|nr:hypothetical protein [Bacillus wiedmannii]
MKVETVGELNLEEFAKTFIAVVRREEKRENQQKIKRERESE